MELHVDARIPFPRDAVFCTYRDHIAELQPYLPNVRRIEAKSREEQGAIVHLVNEWHGGGEIPAALRAVIGDGMLSWTDHAAWNGETLRCDWRTETNAFSEALRCAGQNVFLDDGPGKTLIQVRGALGVDAKRIRGVPGFLAGKIGKAIEEFVGGKIHLNLVETAKGLTKYLETRAGH